MSYFPNLNLSALKLDPNVALEHLGLRRDEPQMADLVLPVLAAFGLGLGLGAGVALLLAPQSGRDLRDDLRHRVGKLEKGMREALPNNATFHSDEGMVDHSADLEYDSSMNRIPS